MDGGQTKIFSVSLIGALNGDPAQNILLESRDRVLVHKSAEAAEPAVVYVQGEVGKPGRYPLTSLNMTVSDLIRVGGGLKASADADNAGSHSRYQWNGRAAGGSTANTKLDGEHQPISLAAALTRDPHADLPLSTMETCSQSASFPAGAISAQRSI